MKHWIVAVIGLAGSVDDIASDQISISGNGFHLEARPEIFRAVSQEAIQVGDAVKIDLRVKKGHERSGKSAPGVGQIILDDRAHYGA